MLLLTIYAAAVGLASLGMAAVGCIKGNGELLGAAAIGLVTVGFLHTLGAL